MRVSATLLEGYRLYTSTDWKTEADLIASIQGVFVPTPAMDLGTAFHAVLETPERWRVAGGYRSGAYAFDDATMAPLFALIDRRGVFEVKATLEIDGHTLVAKADQLCGATIQEFKTTLSTFDAEKYTDSYQWRVMSLIFQPARITYHVASLDDHGNSVVELKSLDSVSLYPYAGLEQDVRDLLREFVGYVQGKGLSEYLERSALAA
jgi:hypothetical protein